MIRGYWTCQRVTSGTKCGAVNPNRKRNCAVCSKPRRARRRPEHMRALELPYAHYVALNGGEWCGICCAEPGARRLHRDHDHLTGCARGLLCFRCNSALRPYMTEEWLENALAYVQNARLRGERAA